MIVVNEKEQQGCLAQITKDIEWIINNDPREGLDDDVKGSVDFDEMRRKDIQTSLLVFASGVLEDEYKRLMDHCIFNVEKSRKVLLENAVACTDVADLFEFIENVCVLTGMQHDIFYSDATRNNKDYSEKEYETARKIREILFGWAD